MGKDSSSSISAILKKYPVFEETDRGKLLCTLTKHEIPVTQLTSYLTSKKFLSEWKLSELLREYAEYFEEMPNFKNTLVCKLTKRTLARDAKAIGNHVNGSRFKRALEVTKETEKKVDNEMATENVEENNTNEKINKLECQQIEESTNMMETDKTTLVENKKNKKFILKNKLNSSEMKIEPKKKSNKRAFSVSTDYEQDNQINNGVNLIKLDSSDDLSNLNVKTFKKKKLFKKSRNVKNLTM